MAEQACLDGRVLIVAPTGYDAQVVRNALQHQNVEAMICEDIAQACEEAVRGAAVLVLAEEAFVPGYRVLEELLATQPAWSDIPIALLMSAASKNRNRGIALRDNMTGGGNVTLLERPLQIHTFLSVIRVALRSRQRQYQVRDLIAQREADLRRREQDLKARDEFLAMLAHELRNPLAPIRNALHVLNLRSAQDDSTRRPREIIERQVFHMVRIIDDLIDVSRLERGKVQLCRETLDLSAAAVNAIESCRADIERRRHRLHVSLSSEPVWIHADPTRLEQMICNLLNNAAKYTSADGQIWLSVSRTGDSGVITVRDNGRGISADMIESIFDIFTQVNSTLDRNEGGLGIGLNLVRKLAELHGGNVVAESPGLGQGSTFTLTLPLCADQGAEKAQQRLSASKDTCSVLVVEDNEDSRESLQVLLGLCGHAVRVAPDGETGLKMLLECEPDVALVDIGLPGLDGYELARRAHVARPHLRTRLVALTGYGQPEDQRRAFECGFSTHVTKPIDPRQLSNILSDGAGAKSSR